MAILCFFISFQLLNAVKTWQYCIFVLVLHTNLRNSSGNAESLFCSVSCCI